MRRLFLIVMALALVVVVGCSQAEAAQTGYGVADDKPGFSSKKSWEKAMKHRHPIPDYLLESKNEFGVKGDAPNLVNLGKGWTLGVEGGKDMYSTNINEGWFGYGKFTFNGCLINCEE